MGHNLIPIGNHQLNTKNVKTLAEDLVSRLNINIEYGYFGFKEDFKIWDKRLYDDEYIVLDKIIKNKKYQTFRLIDENHQLKELYNKYGDELFYKKEYWRFSNEIPNEKRILEAKKELIFPNYELINCENSGEFLNINKEHYSNNIPYLCRWFSLYEFFYGKNEIYQDDLFEFRKSLIDYTLKLGGDKMYYLDDQSSVLKGVGQSDELDMSWKELETFFIEKTQPLLLNVSEFMTNEKYKKEFIAKNEYPLAFIDDFKDFG